MVDQFRLFTMDPKGVRDQLQTSKIQQVDM